ncbi:MAG: hypothetical protein ACFUZC_14570 [Chthoniobacteraceae bacterium]
MFGGNGIAGEQEVASDPGWRNQLQDGCGQARMFQTQRGEEDQRGRKKVRNHQFRREVKFRFDSEMTFLSKLSCYLLMAAAGKSFGYVLFLDYSPLSQGATLAQISG